MVDQYLKGLQKKFKLGKKSDLLSILRDYEVDTDEVLDNGSCLVHLLINDSESELLREVLTIGEDYKSKKPDPNKIDAKQGWSPLVLAIN